MVDITTRATKASTLTYGENDANFLNLAEDKAQGWASVLSEGSDNVFTITYAPAVTAYELNKIYYGYVTSGTTRNSGACTLAINGLSALDIRYLDGTALANGAISKGMYCKFLYNGTYFILLNPSIAHNTQILEVTDFNGPFTAISVLSNIDDTTTIDLDSQLEDTWIEYGPGAHVSATEFSPLNSLPATGVGAVKLAYAFTVTPAAAVFNLRIHARAGNDTQAIANENCIFRVYDTGSTTIIQRFGGEMWVPCDPTDNSFYLAWDAAAGDRSAIGLNFYYKGCMYV
jgi:hypothetical protein